MNEANDTDSDSNKIQSSTINLMGVEAPMEEEPKSIFNPPLYLQRYQAVQNTILEQYNNGIELSDLLDVGCAECKFLQQAKQLTFLSSIKGLDIDHQLLARHSGLLKPLPSDYLLRRKHDIHVLLYSGSITERDPSIKNVDVVTAIEVIEHLIESDLEKMVETVFGYIQPNLVVVTTPNFEFNELFDNGNRFRHWDHKFEWTRDEFKTWCTSICSSYGYDVTYSGVGDPPSSHSKLGHCSQMGIFIKDCSRKLEGLPSSITESTYKLVLSTTYPGDTISDEEYFLGDVQYSLNRYISIREYSDDDNIEIPIADLLDSSYHLKKDNVTVTALADSLESLGHKLSSDRKTVKLRDNYNNPSSPSSNDTDTYSNDVSYLKDESSPEEW